MGIEGRSAFEGGRTLYTTTREPDMEAEELGKLRRAFLDGLEPKSARKALTMLQDDSDLRSTGLVLERVAEQYAIHAAMDAAANGSSTVSSDPAVLEKLSRELIDNTRSLMELAARSPSIPQRITAAYQFADTLAQTGKGNTAQVLHEFSGLILLTSKPTSLPSSGFTFSNGPIVQQVRHPEWITTDTGRIMPYSIGGTPAGRLR